MAKWIRYQTSCFWESLTHLGLFANSILIGGWDFGGSVWQGFCLWTVLLIAFFPLIQGKEPPTHTLPDPIPLVQLKGCSNLEYEENTLLLGYRLSLNNAAEFCWEAFIGYQGRIIPWWAGNQFFSPTFPAVMAVIWERKIKLAIWAVVNTLIRTFKFKA